MARIDLLQYDAPPFTPGSSEKNSRHRDNRSARICMIAGARRGLILVTRNVAEFSRVPGLRVETWG